MCQRPEGGGPQAQRTGPEPAFLETGASLSVKASHCWLSQHLLQIVHLSALLLKTLQCLPDSGVKCSFFPSGPRAPARSTRWLTTHRPASGPLHWPYLGRGFHAGPDRVPPCLFMALSFSLGLAAAFQLSYLATRASIPPTKWELGPGLLTAVSTWTSAQHIIGF